MFNYSPTYQPILQTDLINRSNLHVDLINKSNLQIDLIKYQNIIFSLLVHPGRHLKKTLKWLHEAEQEKATKIVSKRVDEFRERTQEQLGMVHDP